MTYDLQKLSDCQDIRDLTAQYNYLVDTGDAAGYAELFVAEGEFDVVGHAVYRGEIVRRNAYEPILHEDLRQALITLFGDPARKTSPGNTPKWLGSLIYRCRKCQDGTTMTLSRLSGSRTSLRTGNDAWARIFRGPPFRVRRLARMAGFGVLPSRRHGIEKNHG